MLNSDCPLKCGVLYVDDEVKALKYFEKGYASIYDVFTATSAEEGLAILRREAGKIGVVLSDQRMPDMFGADFLGVVREEYPRVVRILITAYTELKDAVAAVNTGHIYQYVAKPGAGGELEMALRRAATYYQVLNERNELLAQKMTTLQRILCSDRVKWLLLWSRGLAVSEGVAFRRALAAYIEALPAEWNPLAADDAPDRVRRFEITGLLRDEFHNATSCLDALDALRSGDGPAGVETAMETLRAGLAVALGGTPAEVSVRVGPDFAVEIHVVAPRQAGCSRSYASALFGLLIERKAPELSLFLLDALRALAMAGGSLDLILESGNPAARLHFQPATLSDAGEAVLDTLAEKFVTADIARL